MAEKKISELADRLTEIQKGKDNLLKFRTYKISGAMSKGIT